jgi:hypothetical protein
MNNPPSNQPRPLNVPTRPSMAPVPAIPVSSGAPPKIAAMPMQGHKPTDEELEPLELIEESPIAVSSDIAPSSKIKAFGVKSSAEKVDRFTRKPVTTGRGACRVRSFHGRLSDEGLAFIDEKINDWLDHHPEIEVKFVTSTTGVFEGKIREPALVLNVWY